VDVKDFRVACGEFSKVANLGREELEKAGRALIPSGFTWVKGSFVARGYGDSNEPKIKDGAWLLFAPPHAGSRDGLFLVRDTSQIGGDLYVLKKYTSKKVYQPDETWSHGNISLHSFNRAYRPIELVEDDSRYQICGRFLGAVDEIERVEEFEFEYVDIDRNDDYE
jgi:phage repressor protein C with HTH and peptisase S24 domain